MQRRAADPLSGPPVEDVLELFDDVVEMNRVSAGFLARVAALTGLQLGELQALQAISRGADHPRAIAGRTGQAKAAVVATVEGLVRRGLVGRHYHSAAPAGRSAPTLLHLTEPGAIAVQQAEGIQIRVLDALATALGRQRISDFKTAVHALTALMDTEHVPTAALDESPELSELEQKSSCRSL